MIAQAAEQAFGVGLVVSAFLFGFRHGIDWDHIAAITDIAGSQDDRRSSIVFGTLYALGHAVVVLAIGSVAIVLGEQLPEGVDAVMERIVGVTLLVLGGFVIVSLVRHGREFRLRSRWMLIFSGVRSLRRRVRRTITAGGDHDHELEPVHVHGGEVVTAVAEEVPVSDWHHGHHGRLGHHHHKHPETDTAFENYTKRTAVVVGMLHGVGAETPTQVLIFVAAAGAGGAIVGEIVLAAFLVGLLASNSLITFGAAMGFLKASENWPVYLTIALLTAGFSLFLGVVYLFGRGDILPAMF